MRALFMGTPAAAVPTLAALAGVADVAAVITQPDAARGRSKHKVAPAVKEAADEWGMPVHQPPDAASLLAAVRALRFDVGVVVAFGRLLRPEVLAASPYGYLNVHFSLLPRWRGPAPVERAILAGDDHTGVAVMQLDEGLDTGPVVAVREVDIDPADTGGSLTARLSHIGADLLIDSLGDYISGRRVPAPQMSGGATAAPMLTTREAQLHSGLEVVDAERMVRAFNPRPGAWLTVAGERVKVLSALITNEDVLPGALDFPGQVPVVGFADGALELLSVQPAGKSLMDGDAWGNGRRHEPAVVAGPD